MSNDLFSSKSNAGEIESGFMVRFAQTELGADDVQELGDEIAQAEAPDPVDAAGGGEEALPNLDTDMDEMEAIKNLVPWDSFGIIFDPHYAKMLEESLGLPPTKSKAKSYYIYFSPENKRLEGVVNKRYIGGYGTKEDLGEDFGFLKSLSPEGFSPDWKEKLLRDIDELPAVDNENIKNKLRDKAEESDDAEEERVDEEEAIEDQDVKPPISEKAEPSQEIAPPSPVGKVDTSQLPTAASIKDKAMKRMSRMKEFKVVLPNDK